MNFGNNTLHDLNTLRNAAISTLEILKTDYNFESYEVPKGIVTGTEYIGLKKNKLVIYIMISKKECFEIMYSDVEKVNTSAVNTFSLVTKKYGMFSTEESEFASNQMEAAKHFQQFSEQQYTELMKFELKFVIDNYGFMLRQGLMLDQ